MERPVQSSMWGAQVPGPKQSCPRQLPSKGSSTVDSATLGHSREWCTVHSHIERPGSTQSCIYRTITSQASDSPTSDEALNYIQRCIHLLLAQSNIPFHCFGQADTDLNYHYVEQYRILTKWQARHQLKMSKTLSLFIRSTKGSFQRGVSSS